MSAIFYSNFIRSKAVALFTGVLLVFPAIAQEAGKVVRLSGDPTVTSLANQTRKLSKDDPVSVGDTISCGDDCSVMLRMKDNATMLVRAKTKIKINEFKFDNQASDTSKTTVLAGTMRAVSGQIGKGQRN